MEFGSSKDVQMAGLNAELASREDAVLPALLIQVPSQSIAGFDCVAAEDAAVSIHELEDKVEELQGANSKDVVISIPAAARPPYYGDDAHVVPYSVSLSMPASPSGFHLSQFRAASARRVEARVAAPAAGLDVHPVEEHVAEVHSPRLLKQTRFHSQPILNLHPSSKNGAAADEGPRRCDSTRDKRFDPFKTFSGRLERQLSNLRGRPQEPVDGGASPESKISEEETDQVPAADRYFDALEGPELDTLRGDGGAGAAERREVAVPFAFPDQRVRDVPGREQPVDPVEDASLGSSDSIPPREPRGEPRPVVRRSGAHGAHLHHLPPQGGVLLRGGASRVLPPDPRKLLLRAVDRVPLPGAGRAPARGGDAPRRLVRAHGAHLRPRAQDLRPVDVRRAAQAVQGRQPVQPPLHRRKLRRRAAGSQDGAPRGTHLLLRRRARALHGALRHALPEAPHQRHAPQGAPPGVLPLRRRTQRRVHGMGQDQRPVRRRRTDRVLHRALPLHVTGGADQLLPGVQVLAGVVGVHVPDDGGVGGHDHVRDGGDQRADAGALHRALRDRNCHRGGAAGDHGVPRIRAQGPVPQRRVHRHHAEEAQVQQDPRAPPLLQLRHEGARLLALQQDGAVRRRRHRDRRVRHRQATPSRAVTRLASSFSLAVVGLTKYSCY